MPEEVTEWKVEGSFITRMQFRRWTDDSYISPRKGYLEVEFVTGVGYSYSQVPIESITDLLSADDVGASFEYRIAHKHADHCRRTATSPGLDPAIRATGQFDKYENRWALDEAIEAAKEVAETREGIHTWRANKQRRIEQWFERIERTSAVLARSEEVRLAAEPPLLKSEIQWSAVWGVQSGFIKRIRYTGWINHKYLSDGKGTLEVEFITGVGYGYSIAIDDVPSLLGQDEPSRYFENQIAKRYWDRCHRSNCSGAHDPAYGTTGRFSMHRNSDAMFLAIADAKEVMPSFGSNPSWIAQKHQRLKAWVRRIGIFNPGLAEREGTRLEAWVQRLAEVKAERERTAAKLGPKIGAQLAKWLNGSGQSIPTPGTSSQSIVGQLRIEPLSPMRATKTNLVSPVCYGLAKQNEEKQPPAQPSATIATEHAEQQAQPVKNNQVSETPRLVEGPAKSNFPVAAKPTQAGDHTIQQKDKAKLHNSTSHQSSAEPSHFWDQRWFGFLVILMLFAAFGALVGGSEGLQAALVIEIILGLLYAGMGGVFWLHQLVRKPGSKNVVEPTPLLTPGPLDTAVSHLREGTIVDVKAIEAKLQLPPTPPLLFEEGLVETSSRDRSEALNKTDESVHPQRSPRGILAGLSDDTEAADPQTSHPATEHIESRDLQRLAIEGPSIKALNLDVEEDGGPDQGYSGAASGAPERQVILPDDPNLSEPVAVAGAQEPDYVSESATPRTATKSPRQLRRIETNDNDGESTETSPLSPTPGLEGQRKLRTNYESVRNQKLRDTAIQIHGRDCCVCGFNFDKFFGENLARGYIEVHHLKKIADGERSTNPITDLAPLCANCHAMADRLTSKLEAPPQTIAELRAFLLRASLGPAPDV